MGGGSVPEGRRRAGRVTVAPPDPVTSRRARREPRATLVLGEADSALAGGSWRPCPPAVPSRVRTDLRCVRPGHPLLLRPGI